MPFSSSTMMSKSIQTTSRLYIVCGSRCRALSSGLLSLISIIPRVIDNGGNIVNWWTAKFSVLNRGERRDKFPKDHYVDVSFLTGRGTLIPVQVFHQIGLYDEKHFQQCGDTEFPVRAKKAGYRLIVSYDAVVKSPVTSSDSINVSNHYLLKDITSYFLGIRSNFRLKYRFFFSLKTAASPLRFISFFTLDLLRITGHFCRGLTLTGNR